MAGASFGVWCVWCTVMLAKAGISGGSFPAPSPEIPAFAGMTVWAGTPPPFPVTPGLTPGSRLAADCLDDEEAGPRVKPGVTRMGAGDLIKSSPSLSRGGGPPPEAVVEGPARSGGGTRGGRPAPLARPSSTRFASGPPPQLRWGRILEAQ